MADLVDGVHYEPPARAALWQDTSAPRLSHGLARPGCRHVSFRAEPPRTPAVQLALLPRQIQLRHRLDRLRLSTSAPGKRSPARLDRDGRDHFCFALWTVPAVEPGMASARRQRQTD